MTGPLILLLLAGTTSFSCRFPAEDQWRRQYCTFLHEFMRARTGIYVLDSYPLLATPICSLRGGMLSEPTLKRRKTIAECNVTVVNGSNTIKRRMEWMLPPSEAKIYSRASMSKPAYSDSAKSSLEHMRCDVQARLPAHSSKQQQIDQQLRHLQVPRLYFSFFKDSIPLQFTCVILKVGH